MAGRSTIRNWNGLSAVSTPHLDLSLQHRKTDAEFTYIRMLRPPYLEVFSVSPYYCCPCKTVGAMRIAWPYNRAPILSFWHCCFCYSNCFDGTSLSVQRLSVTNDKQIEKLIIARQMVLSNGIRRDDNTMRNNTMATMCPPNTYSNNCVVMGTT